MAQMIRAFLLAAATAAIFLLRNQITEQLTAAIGFSFTLQNTNARTVAEQHSQIHFAPFADVTQFVFAVAGVLLQHNIQPSGKITATWQLLRITDAGYYRGRADRSNP